MWIVIQTENVLSYSENKFKKTLNNPSRIKLYCMRRDRTVCVFTQT